MLTICDFPTPPVRRKASFVRTMPLPDFLTGFIENVVQVQHGQTKFVRATQISI